MTIIQSSQTLLEGLEQMKKYILHIGDFEAILVNHRIIGSIQLMWCYSFDLALSEYVSIHRFHEHPLFLLPFMKYTLFYAPVSLIFSDFPCISFKDREENLKVFVIFCYELATCVVEICTHINDLMFIFCGQLGMICTIILIAQKNVVFLLPGYRTNHLIVLFF